MDIEVTGGMGGESFEILRRAIEAARILRRSYGLSIYVKPSLELLNQEGGVSIRVGDRVLYVDSKIDCEKLAEMILDASRNRRVERGRGYISLEPSRREPVSGSGALIDIMVWRDLGPLLEPLATYGSQ